MLEGTSLVSNDTKTLRDTAGETIHDVIMVESRIVNTRGPMGVVAKQWNKLFVFKSGYSLEITGTGAFWVNGRKDTMNIIQSELDRRLKITAKVEEAEHAIEIFRS